MDEKIKSSFSEYKINYNPASSYLTGGTIQTSIPYAANQANNFSTKVDEMDLSLDSDVETIENSASEWLSSASDFLEQLRKLNNEEINRLQVETDSLQAKYQEYLSNFHLNLEREELIKKLENQLNVLQMNASFSYGLNQEDEISRLTEQISALRKEELEEKIQYIKEHSNEFESFMGMGFEEYNQKIIYNEYTILELKAKDYQLRQQAKELPYEQIKTTEEYISYVSSYTGGSEKSNTYLANRNLENYLSEEQLIMFSYLYDTRDFSEANAYLEAIEDKINQSKGMAEAQVFFSRITDEEGNVDVGELEYIFTTMGQGLLNGVETFGEGFENLFDITSDGMVTDNQYAQQFILQGLSELQEKGQISKFVDDTYQISTSIGNMLPGSIISILTGGTVGHVLMGMSAAGNAKNEALVSNSDNIALAYLYGAFNGASEAVVGKIMGNIPGLNEGAKFAVKEIFSEGAEEFVQTYVDAGLKAVVYGEIPDLGELTEEGLKSFLYGCITSGIMTGSQTAISFTINGVKYSYNNMSELINAYSDDKITKGILEQQVEKVDFKSIEDIALYFGDSKSNSTLDNIIEQLGNGNGRRLLAMYASTGNIKHIPTEFRSQMESIPIDDIKTYLNPEKINIGTQYFGESSNQATNSTFPDDAAQRLVGNLKATILYYPALFLQQPTDALKNAFNNPIVRDYILGLNVKEFSNIINVCTDKKTCKWLECDVFVDKIMSMNDSEFYDFAAYTGTRKKKLINNFVDNGGDISGYLKILGLIQNRYMSADAIKNNPNYIRLIDGFLPYSTFSNDINEIRASFEQVLEDEIYNSLSSNSMVEIVKGKRVPEIENLDSNSTYIVKCEVYGQIHEYEVYTYDGNCASMNFINLDENLKQAILSGNVRVLSCEKVDIDSSDLTSEKIVGGDFDLSTVSVDKYSSSVDIYSSRKYGGNQSDISRLVSAFINKQNVDSISLGKSELLYDTIKKYFPNASDMEIINIAEAYNSSGCAYMAISNAFCTYIGSLENGEQFFREKFGYDLYFETDDVRSYNLEAVALDMFCNVVKHDDIKTITKQNSYGLSTTKYYNILNDYFSQKSITVGVNIQSVGSKDKKEALSEIMFNSPDDSFNILSAGNFDIEYVSGIPLVDFKDKDAALEGIKIDGKYLRGIGGHAMTITGIDTDGNLLVSSWSGKYKFGGGSTGLSPSIITIKFKVMEEN